MGKTCGGGTSGEEAGLAAAEDETTGQERPEVVHPGAKCGGQAPGNGEAREVVAGLHALDDEVGRGLEELQRILGATGLVGFGNGLTQYVMKRTETPIWYWEPWSPKSPSMSKRRAFPILTLIQVKIDSLPKAEELTDQSCS